MFSLSFPIVSAALLLTYTAQDPDNGRVQRTRYEFILAGLAAHAIEEAQHAHFYGVHANTREAGEAIREISDSVSTFLNQNSIPWNSFNVTAADAIDTSGTPHPYRAKVAVTVQY